MSKLLYSKDDEIPVVHIADVPPKEHPLMFCGEPRTNIENRVYCTYADSLPGKYTFCPGCLAEIKHRLGTEYRIPEWIKESKRVNSIEKVR